MARAECGCSEDSSGSSQTTESGLFFGVKYNTQFVDEEKGEGPWGRINT